MFVCNYDRKNFIDDHRQKYVEITKNCLGNEIADERLRFLQTKHLQCAYIANMCILISSLVHLKNEPNKTQVAYHFVYIKCVF